MQTEQELYESEILVLAPSERLRLATLILEGLTESSAATMDFSDHWTEEDIQDVVAYSAQHAGESLGEE